MERNYDVYAAKEHHLFAVVGDAMSRWAALENQLLQLFAAAAGISLPMAGAIMTPVKTFQVALQITDQAMKAKLGNDIRRWATLHNYINELAGERNFIAHTPVVAHGAEDPDAFDWANAEPVIGPSMKGYLVKPQNLGCRSLDEVREIVEDIQQAVELTMSLAQRVAAADHAAQDFDTPITRRRPPKGQRRAGK